jgi:Asp-tRNA(Asn)/Glu-tRNA(Gln) amidotransferase A subunit family amidase
LEINKAASGGSLRIPASFNGVFSIKVSHHRTLEMNSTMCVMGPLATSAADLTIAYRICAKPNPDDPVQSKFALSIPPGLSEKKTIGICKEWWSMADPRVQEVCQEAVDYFGSKNGYDIIDIEIPNLWHGQLAHAASVVAEMSAFARSRTSKPSDWLSIVGAPNQVLMSVGQHSNATDYITMAQLRQVMMEHLAFLYEKYPGLMILSPTSPLPGWRIKPGDEVYGMSDTNLTIRNMAFVFLANLTGCPAVTGPAGYIEPEQGDGKIPIGLMSMGEWGQEERLLSWARELEAYLHEAYPGGRIRPSGWVDVIGLAKGTVKAEAAEASDGDGE